MKLEKKDFTQIKYNELINYASSNNMIIVDKGEYYETEKVEEPVKTFEELNQEKISEYQRYLADTDYVVVKISEAIAENDEKLLLELKNKYSSVLQKRKETRNNIKELENISTNFNQE